MQYIQSFLDYQAHFLINDGSLPTDHYDPLIYCVEKPHKYLRLATNSKKESFGQIAFFINEEQCIYEIFFDGHKHENKVKKSLGIDSNSTRAQNVNIKNIIPFIKALIDDDSILIGECYYGKNYFRFNLQN